MALESIPPWLNITPNLFSQALEAGARTGLALTDQSLRAQALAQAQAERQAEAQERAAREAERQREFEETRLLNVQKIAQDAAQLQQLQKHQAAQEANQALQESRLLNYQQGLLGVRQQEANQAGQTLTPSLVDLGGGAKGVVMGKTYHPLSPSATASPHPLGELIPVTDKITGTLLGNVVATGPNTGHFEKAEGVKPTVPQQVQIETARGRILQSQIRDSLTMPFEDAAARADYVQKRRTALEDVNQKLAGLSAGTNAPTVLGPRRSIAVTGQGTRDDPAKPTTPEQMDSLPSKAYYINPKDGKLYQKK